MRRCDLSPGTVFTYKGHPDTFYFVPDDDNLPHPLTPVKHARKSTRPNDEASVVVYWEPSSSVLPAPAPTPDRPQQAHYTGMTPEPIDVMQAWFSDNALRFCAMKYLARAGRKGDKQDAIKDLTKAITYLQREINAMGGEAKW